jgi:hypothetical protein
LHALLAASLVPTLGMSHTTLYRIERDLLALSELKTAATVKAQFYGPGPGEDHPHIWLARVGEIARRLRPAVPKTFH